MTELLKENGFAHHGQHMGISFVPLLVSWPLGLVKTTELDAALAIGDEQLDRTIVEAGRRRVPSCVLRHERSTPNLTYEGAGPNVGDLLSRHMVYGNWGNAPQLDALAFAVCRQWAGQREKLAAGNREVLPGNLARLVVPRFFTPERSALIAVQRIRSVML